MTDNAKGIIYMVLAMFFLTVSDAFIKEVSDQVTFGQVLFSMGLIGSICTAAYTIVQGRKPLRREMLQPAIFWRILGDMIGASMIFIALARNDLGLVAVVVQASPILLAVFAVMILGEQVGWRRWTSILVGFIGVLLVVNPFEANFDVNILFAVGALIGLTLRDFATRFVTKTIAPVEMATIGFMATCPLGLVVMAINQPPITTDITSGLYLLAAIFLGIFGLVSMAAAMRFGDVSATAPFRYSRIIFSVAVGYILFSEWPTPLMWLGIALVIGSGLFLLSRQKPAGTKP